MRLLRLGWAACASLVLALVLSSSVLGSPAHARADDTPVKLLYTGDSITHGRHLDLTWRYWVDRELRRQGVDFEAVGSSSTPFQDAGYPTSRYGAAFEGRHFARAGARLSWLATQIEAEVREQRPDVVVLLAGINDFLGGATVDAVESSLRAWVRAVRAAGSPTIVLCRVLTQKYDGLNTLVTQYNARLDAVRAELSTPESPIVLVDTGAGGWTPDLT